MTLISDEIIEKAARAAYADLVRCLTPLEQPHRDWEDLRQQERGHWCSRARAALLAALPDIVEEIAKVGDGWLAMFGHREIRHISARIYASDAVKDVSTAIRQLSTNTKGDGQ